VVKGAADATIPMGETLVPGKAIILHFQYAKFALREFLDCRYNRFRFAASELNCGPIEAVPLHV
jgi:hypothetical protein